MATSELSEFYVTGGTLRAGALGIAPYGQFQGLMLALGAIFLSLIALAHGVDLFAGELADSTLTQVVTLPISRTACFVGKWLGRIGVSCGLYLLAYGSIAIAHGIVHPEEGVARFAAAIGAGLLLFVTCMATGILFGILVQDRLRAFGSALVVWVLFVFLLDAVLLAALTVAASPNDVSVGMHGHSELSAHAKHMRDAAGDGSYASPRIAWLMVLNPVDLFRLTVVAPNPALASSGAPPLAPTAMAGMWVLWIGIPAAIGLYRFRRMHIP